MLKGIDVSHHNNLDRILSIIDKPDFCIIKATEGKTFNDSKFKHNIQICQERDIPIGFYHYARPENNPALVEAKHFLDRVAPYIGNSILALDWEGEALKHPISWALTWLNHIYAQTGVRPVFYCSASYTKNLKTLFDNNYGLWVAHYTDLKQPIIGAYKYWAFWQYSSPEHNHTGGQCICDYDYFNGSQAALHAYMKVQQPRY